MSRGYVYIMARRRNGTLYVGVTSDLVKRVYEYKQGLTGGFTSKYQVHRLVFFECHDDMREAIAAEKKYKDWHRRWKIRLIESVNPTWRDLSEDIGG
ncbi:MAG: GIY-YIG nuclease family protein [bacterium]